MELATSPIVRRLYLYIDQIGKSIYYWLVKGLCKDDPLISMEKLNYAPLSTSTFNALHAYPF